MQQFSRCISVFKISIIVVLTIVATILLLRAFDARKLPDLNSWHWPAIDSEYSVNGGDHIASLADYFELEGRVFNELEISIFQSNLAVNTTHLNHYISGSPVDPNNFKQSWNRSYELVPNNVRGGVLMLHGLTDSPYSMRHTANLFYEKEFYVLSLRMPGHGTIPGELIDATWQDWMAITNLGARHVRNKISDELPFFMVGYSNGGALAVKYSIDSIEQQDLPKPDKLVLMSPMMGVTVFSRFSNWHKLLSWIPYFEKFRWLDVLQSMIHLNTTLSPKQLVDKPIY